MGVHTNIKADMAVIIIRSIHPPHLSIGFSNGQAGQLLRKSMGDFDCVTNIAAWKFPTGPAGNIEGHGHIFHDHCGKEKRTVKPSFG
jgi:hypothetical protein